MNQFELRPCTVCGLLDGDYRPKKCSYCSVCDVWLCQKDVGDVVRRAVAAYKRQKGRLRKEWDKLKNIMFMGYGDEWSVVDDAGGGVLFVEQVLASGPTVVQSAGCTAGTTTCNATFSSPITAGNRIIAWVDVNGTHSLPTMTGETFVISSGVNGCGQIASGGFGCYIDSSAVGGQTSFVFNATSGSFITGIAVEVSSPVGQATPDAAGNGTSAASTSYSISTSGSTSHAPDLVLACFYEQGTFGTTLAVGTGYALVTFQQYNGGTTYMIVEKAPALSTGTQTATATASNSVFAVFGIAAVAR